MKRKGRMMSMRTTPLTRTSVLKARPTSVSKVVDPGEPRVALPLPGHDHVEEPSVEQDDGYEQHDVSDERSELPSKLAASRQPGGEMCAQGLHGEQLMPERMD
jgi:hypothetical protein